MAPMPDISASHDQDPSPEAQLDTEIADIRAQIKSLTQRRATLTSTLLSSKSTQSLLKRVKFAPLPNEASTPSSIIPNDDSPLLSAALSQSKQHTNHNQECLYRMCIGATMFKVQDPDPNAVDEGRTFGVRIEVFSGDKFLPPYYLILNRPYSNSSFLRIHRHTIPPSINLPSLRTKHLPAPTPDSLKPRKQNLPHLVRELRRELVSYHLRLDSITELRATMGLNDRPSGSRNGIKEIISSDAEVQNIRITWKNGNLGLVNLAKDGKIEKCIIMGQDGRERGIERNLMSGDGHIRGLAQRLLDCERK